MSDPLRDDLPPDELESSYPLSPMQQGMLFHSLYSWNSGVDVEQMVCTLEESLDAPLLRLAWERLVARHPILRTSFRWEGIDDPLQDVHLSADLPWREEDWRESSSEELQLRLQSYLDQDRQKGFDLRRAPLMRIALFRQAAEEFLLIWTFQHALLDGRSFETLLREVFGDYEALQRGQEFHAPDRRPFRDYIEWLSGWDFAAAERFWRRVLAGFTEPTALPGVSHRSHDARAFGEQEEQTLALSAETTARLGSVAREHGLTLSTIVQGAWAILLSRHTGRKDVVFGATRANRQGTIPGAESMVGVFINTLPVRVRVSEDMQLIPWLHALRQQQIEVRAFAHTPLFRVQEWSDLPGGTPLFETLLVFERYQLNTVLRGSGGEWAKRSFRLLEKTNYPLTLAANSESNLTLGLAYERSLFGDVAIGRILQELATILEGMAIDPHGRISALPILPVAERLLIDSWNQTRVDYPHDLCIHQLFEIQAAATPEARAVVSGTKHLTYRALDGRANQLARYLRSAGVGPGVIVGLRLDRSLDMAVALLGVLKAGGAYLPFDPAYPPERFVRMLDESGASLVVTQESLKRDLPPLPAKVLAIDSDGPSILSESDEKPLSGVTPADLAYVIYTSGSTGEPKGVRITHRSLVNHCLGIRDRFELAPGDRVLQFSSLGFDVAAEEIFPTWASGAALVVRSDAMLDSFRDFGEFLRAQRVTVANLPSSYWHEWVSDLSSSGGVLPSTLRLIVVGSEAVSPRRLKDWRNLAGGRVRWLNAYGLSETTITSTLYEPPEDTDGSDPEEEEMDSVPIGRPLPNTRVHLLDSELRQVPIGAPGELFIGGAGVASGYLNRPNLTSERFVPDPFDPDPGARLYRTGDRGAFLEDGNLMLSGRFDDQVKIRGYRVEPAEVEAALARCESVREAAVIERRDDPGGARLVAYVVPEPNAIPSPESLRTYLGRLLPDYMIPSAFVLSNAIPRTPSGKVDRKAVAALLERVRASGPLSSVEPRNDLERQLATIWEETLGVKPIGISDNFFDLGGHSLLAAKLVARIERAVGRSLPLVVLFDAPTIGRLADLLRKEEWVPPWSSLVPIRREGSKVPLFCVHGVGGNVVGFRDLAKHLTLDQPVYGLQAVGLDGRQAPLTRVEDMARHYIKEIRVVQPEGHTTWQVPPSAVPWPLK